MCSLVADGRQRRASRRLIGVVRLRALGHARILPLERGLMCQTSMATNHRVISPLSRLVKHFGEWSGHGVGGHANQQIAITSEADSKPESPSSRVAGSVEGPQTSWFVPSFPETIWNKIAARVVEDSHDGGADP